MTKSFGKKRQISIPFVLFPSKGRIWIYFVHRSSHSKLFSILMRIEIKRNVNSITASVVFVVPSFLTYMFVYLTTIHSLKLGSFFITGFENAKCYCYIFSLRRPPVNVRSLCGIVDFGYWMHK